jgi:hypothetical protein
LTIGFGIKRTSHSEIKLPVLLGLFPSLLGRELIPLEPRIFVVACFVEAVLPFLGGHRRRNKAARPPTFTEYPKPDRVFSASLRTLRFQIFAAFLRIRNAENAETQRFRGLGCR